MKAITNLLFVALLIGVALSLPTRVRASGGEYTCHNPNYPECYDPLLGWMQQCMEGCSESGSGQGTQYCYSTSYSGCFPPNPDGTVTCYSSTYNDCDTIPSNAQSCAQQCVNEYNSQYNNCLSDWCTQD
jgi:hypothetical protein